MPIYEYQCSACGLQKEVMQKISDAPLKTCPECGKDSMQKMVSAAAFRLKGGGWYETDFKSGNKKNVAGSEAKSEASTTTSVSADSAGKADKAGSSTTTTKKSSDAS
jgi:putative FmdB family regulatory protein